MNILSRYMNKPIYMLSIEKDYEWSKEFKVELFYNLETAISRLEVLYENEQKEMFSKEFRIEKNINLEKNYANINDGSNYFYLDIKKVIPR